MKDTLSHPDAPFRQGAGTIHMHPNGRFVYLTNRASREVEFEGKKVFAGGENSVAVYSINPETGEPTLIQNIDGHGIQLRTFAIDPSRQAAGRRQHPAVDGARRQQDREATGRPVGLPHRRRWQAHLRAQIRCRHRHQDAVLERHGDDLVARPSFLLSHVVLFPLPLAGEVGGKGYLQISPVTHLSRKQER